MVLLVLQTIKPGLYPKQRMHVQAAMVGLAAGIMAPGISHTDTGPEKDSELASISGDDIMTFGVYCRSGAVLNQRLEAA